MKQVEKKGQLTREKEEAELIKRYENILEMLQNKEIEKGVVEMRKILQEKLIQEKDFQNLRRACYISLAEVYFGELKLYDESLHYYNKAIMIQNNDFQTWFKMGQLSRKQNYLPQSETCFFQALQFTPSQLYENIIYENLTAISFLQEQWEKTLQRLDVLIQNQHKRDENLFLKGYILGQLGEQNNQKQIQEIENELREKYQNIDKEKRENFMIPEYWSLQKLQKIQKKSSQQIQQNSQTQLQRQQQTPQKQRTKDFPKPLTESERNQDIHIDQLIRQLSKKNNIPLKQKLQKFQSSFYDKLDDESQQQFKDSFKLFYSQHDRQKKKMQIQKKYNDGLDSALKVIASEKNSKNKVTNILESQQMELEHYSHQQSQENINEQKQQQEQENLQKEKLMMEEFNQFINTDFMDFFQKSQTQIQEQNEIENTQLYEEQNIDQSSYYLNMFWMEQKFVRLNVQDIYNQKITQIKEKFDQLNKQTQKEKEIAQIDPSQIIVIEEEDDTFEDQQQQILNKKTIENFQEAFDIFHDKLYKNYEDAFDLFYKKVYDQIIQVNDLTVFCQCYKQILLAYFDSINGRLHSQDIKKNLINVDMKFKMDKILISFQSIFYATVQKKLIQYDKIKKDIVVINIYILKILLVQLFFSDLDSHSKYFRLFYILTIYMIDNEIPYYERKEQERQLQNYQHLEAISNFFFFQHFLIHLHSNQTFMTEIHQKFVEEQLFQNEVQKCFHYLEMTEEKIKEQKKQSSQDEDDDDEDDLDDEQSKLKKQNQKNSFSSEEDEDLSESSGSEWNDDDIDEDDRVYEELRTYFKCVYGIKNRKKRKILVYNDSINNQNCSWITKKFANFEEIISLSKFIKRIYPNYLTDIHQVFNTQVQQLLLGTFDYMKQNDSYWALCDGIVNIKKQFGKWIRENCTQVLDFIVERINNPNKFCFCEKKNCFEKLMKNYELPDLLFLVGRAHEDVNPSEKDTSEIKIQKNQKSALVKAEKMFTLNILLRPQQVLNWQVLGGVYEQLTFIYFDNVSFDPINQKILELKEHFLYTKKIYNFILDNFTQNQIVTNNIQEELTLLNILKMYERKINYIVSIQEPEPLYFHKQCLIKKKKYNEIKAKMYKQNYPDDMIRRVYFQELYVFRSYFKAYTEQNLYNHFKRLNQMKQLINQLEPDMIEEDSKNKDQDSNSQTKEKEKQNSHISKQINQNFEGENYDIEFQLEYYISIFKIVKLYLATSKFLLVKYENIKEFSHKLYRDFSVKFESDENIEKIQDITFKIFLPIYEQIQKLMENLIQKWKVDNFELFNEIAASNNESIDLNEILQRNNSQLSFKQYTKIIQFLQANQHQHQKEQEEIIISEHQVDQQQQQNFQKTEQSEQNENKQSDNQQMDKMQEEEQTKEEKENNKENTTNLENNKQIEISENSNNITNLDKNVENIQNNQPEVDINKLKQEIDEKNKYILSQLSLVISNCAQQCYYISINRYKKHRYKRFYYRGIFYSSKMYQQLFTNQNSKQKAYKIIQEIVNQKSEEIVSIYTHMEAQSIEKDQKLMYFFSRDLVFLLDKYKILKHLIYIYSENQELEKLRLIQKKLFRSMIKKIEDECEKEKENTKNQTNQKEKSLQNTNQQINNTIQQNNSSEPKEEKEKINKIFQKLYIFSIYQQLNQMENIVEAKQQLSQENQQLLPKQIYELYLYNVKQKNTYKYIENNPDIPIKINNLLIKYHLKIQEDQEEVHKFQQCDEKEQINIATKSLEDQFKKKKKKIVNKNEQLQSQQQDNQNKMQEEISN